MAVPHIIAWGVMEGSRWVPRGILMDPERPDALWVFQSAGRACEALKGIRRPPGHMLALLPFTDLPRHSQARPTITAALVVS